MINGSLTISGLDRRVVRRRRWVAIGRARRVDLRHDSRNSTATRPATGLGINRGSSNGADHGSGQDPFFSLNFHRSVSGHWKVWICVAAMSSPYKLPSGRLLNALQRNFEFFKRPGIHLANHDASVWVDDSGVASSFVLDSSCLLIAPAIRAT